MGFEARLAACCLALLLAVGAARTAEVGAVLSERGLYRVSYTSELRPLAINRIHAWTLHIETADGQPVENADIGLDGGMPAHDHGLPTRPRVTEYLGGGDYRVEGLRFHMPGRWEIVVDIRDGDTTDAAVILLQL